MTVMTPLQLMDKAEDLLAQAEGLAIGPPYPYRTAELLTQRAQAYIMLARARMVGRMRA